MVVNVLTDDVRAKIHKAIGESRERGNTRAELKNSMLEALYIRETGRSGFAGTFDEHGETNGSLYLYMYDRKYAEETMVVNLPSYMDDDGINIKRDVIRPSHEKERFPGLLCTATQIFDATVAWCIPYIKDGFDLGLYNLEYDKSKVDFSNENIFCVFTDGVLDISEPVKLDAFKY